MASIENFRVSPTLRASPQMRFKYINFRYVILTLLFAASYLAVKKYATYHDISYHKLRKAFFLNDNDDHNLLSRSDQFTTTDDHEETTSFASGKSPTNNCNDRCHEVVHSSSTHTTNCIDITINSMYQGRQKHSHRWSYDVKFKNNGGDTGYFVHQFA